MPQLLILVFSVAVGLYILYCVIRAGVRDGIRAARADVEQPDDLAQPASRNQPATEQDATQP